MLRGLTTYPRLFKTGLLLLGLMGAASLLAVACGGEAVEPTAAPAPTTAPAAPAPTTAPAATATAKPAATTAPAATATAKPAATVAATTAPTATARPAATTAPAATKAPVATATSAAAGPTAAPAGSQYGGTLNFAYFRAPTPPDGYQSSGGFEGFFIWTNNESVLGRGVGSTVNTNESLATKWEVLDDGLRIRLHVRKGVQFQGGLGEMTTEDVAWSFNRWFEQGAAGCGGCASAMRAVKSVAAVDKDVVDISMTRLDANYIIKLTGREAIVHSKKHWTAIGGADAHKSKPIGTGAYKLTEWQPGTVIKYERHYDWWQG
ncbi:MAG: hypothetical protein HYY34_03315 [Chloroflexi bacterium]|nr:hypothetical protein [Chloroflexota bacterium]